MFTEDDLLPISALQHLLFCERQCALIHVEGLWADNVLTVEGTHMHRRSDEGADEKRDGVRIVRALPLRSLRLGLAGRADVVEFHRGEPGAAWAPFPVEYKRGRAKRERCDQVQLCAQALCLEEMLGVEIPAGALFYGQTRRREDVAFDAPLRADTGRAVERLREMVSGGITPRARREPKCERCSLIDLCLPDAVSPGRSAVRYLERSLAALDANDQAPPL